jgi:16S rRNA (adenine1518-N6/adenine1519-N6)-dimethyltransferase
VEGDVIKVSLPQFNKAVSIPQYYLSSRLVMWLLERKIDCAVLVFQKEFAAKLTAAVGSDDYGWLTVVGCYGAEIELLEAVPKSMFYPQPEVDSAVIRMVPWKTAPFEVKDDTFFNRMVRWLFTQRNKKLHNALVPFLKSTRSVSKEEAEKAADAAPFGGRRVRELSPKDFGVLANVLMD